jgi:hypothetical protein
LAGSPRTVDIERLDQFKAEYRRRWPFGVANSYLDAIAEKLSKLNSLEERAEAMTDEHELCDTCGSLAIDTTDVDGDGHPLGHVQCGQCSQIADLEHRLRSTESRLDGACLAFAAYYNSDRGSEAEGTAYRELYESLGFSRGPDGRIKL